MKRYIIVLCLLLSIPILANDFIETNQINPCFQGAWIMVGMSSTGKDEDLKPMDADSPTYNVPTYIVSSTSVRDRDGNIMNVQNVAEGITQGANRQLFNVVMFDDKPDLGWKLIQVNTKVGNLIALNIMTQKPDPKKKGQYISTTIALQVFRIDKDMTSFEIPEKKYNRPVIEPSEFKKSEPVIK